MNRISRKFILSVAISVCLLAVSTTAWASGAEDGVLRYKIPVINGAERFMEILKYPTSLAVALQNNGIRIAGNYDVKIKDRQTFDIKGIEVKFIKKDGNLFFYQVKLDLSIMAGKAPPSLTMVVDVSELRNEAVDVSVSSSLVKYLPENVREIIKVKIQKMASEHNQKKIIEYFNKLLDASPHHDGIRGVLGGIVIDAYNLHINRDGEGYKAHNKLSQMNSYPVFVYILIVCLIIMLVYILKMKRAKSKE